MIRRSFGCTSLYRAASALWRQTTTLSKRWAREALTLEQLEPRLLLAAGVRTKLDNQGYLHFDEDAEIAVIGWERVGGTTVEDLSRYEPAEDRVLGFDKSSLQVVVNPWFIKDKDGEEPAVPFDRHSRVSENFEYANQVFAHAGLSILAPEGYAAALHTDDNITYPVNGNSELATLASNDAHRHDDSKVINSYYVKSLAGFLDFLNHAAGRAAPPNHPSFTRGTNDGFAVGDAAIDKNLVFAHELGHYLLASDAKGGQYGFKLQAKVDDGVFEANHAKDGNNLMGTPAEKDTPLEQPTVPKETKDEGTNGVRNRLCFQGQVLDAALKSRRVQTVSGTVYAFKGKFSMQP